MAVCIQLVIEALFNIPVVGGLIAGAILGGGFGILVLFGMHWVIIGLALGLIAQNGYDYIMACGGIGPMIGMFQGLAICWACRKNKKVRDLAIPATISQICGVGEPLMYSILIPIKKLFLINILGGCIGGAIIGMLKTKMYMFGGSGLFGIFNYAGGGGMQDIVKLLHRCRGRRCLPYRRNTHGLQRRRGIPYPRLTETAITHGRQFCSAMRSSLE